MKLSMMINNDETENQVRVEKSVTLTDGAPIEEKDQEADLGSKKTKAVGAFSVLMLLAFAGVAYTQSATGTGPEDANSMIENVKVGNKIGITPAGGVTRRLLKQEIRARALLETIVEGEQGRHDEELDGMGREYLGTTPHGDIKVAFQRFQDDGEDVEAEVVLHGHDYIEKLVLGDMASRHHSFKRGGGLHHGPPEGKNKHDTTQYLGIYVEGHDQEFQIECDEDEDAELPCEVYSVGVFVPPATSSRRLASRQIYDEQCQDDSDCPGAQTCYTPNYTPGVSSTYYNKCTCSEKSECAFLFESGGAFRSYFNSHGEHDTEYKCSGAADYCLGYYDSGCFAASMTVTTPEGPKRMDEVRVNDLVLTASGTYEKVYAFLHRKPESAAPMKSAYLQIATEAGNQIELTDKHMIYVNNSEHPTGAKNVKVGDTLSLLDQDSKMESTKVTSIQVVLHRGAFSPLTESGTIVVNGIAASSYNNPIYAETEFVEIAGMPLVHRATFTQWLTTPVRVYCLHVDGRACEVDMDAETKMPLFGAVETSYYFIKAAGIESAVMFAATVLVMAFFALEQAFHALWFPFLAVTSLLALGRVVIPQSKQKML